ncbi:Hsp70 family protein [Candidatus Sumerlaeota bacterium]|nr:Hsp70 family protein [Candidatus Sumerlaeota bacterium]
MSDLIAGIDLGTTNSEIAVYRDGGIQVVEKEGEMIMPSYTGLSPQGELLVGTPAKNQYVLYPELTVKSIKRKMGTSERVKLGEKDFAPQEISAMILRALKERAEYAVGEKIGKAIITVPAHFSDPQRQATREAGEIAGFQVLRIINEPTAASLAYDLDHEMDQTILVYDLGGGTFDVSLIQIQKGVIEVLASHGDNNLGGDDFDQKILHWLLERFRNETGVDISEDRRCVNRLLHAAEEAKKRLSFEPFTFIREDHLAEKDGLALHLNVELSRGDFEKMIFEYLDKTLDSIHQALNDAGKAPDEISQILLVGGSTRIPAVMELIINLTGVIPRQDIHPDLCVALGAGVLASREMGVKEDKILVDVTPFTFGIETLEFIDGYPVSDRFSPVIYRNTPLPASRTQLYSTVDDGQDAVAIKIYQGEDDVASNNLLIGDFLVQGLRNVPAGNQILVRMDLDLDGILHVSATEKQTGLSKKITIRDSFTQMDKEQRSLARHRLDSMFQSPEKEQEETFSYHAMPDESSADSSLRTRIISARALVEKSQRLVPSMNSEDRSEAETLNHEILEAIEEQDMETIREKVETLADLLFYVDDNQ